MPSPAISVTELDKYFAPALTGWRAFTHPVARATEKALAGVSFAVKENEAVALIGSNGAGKSTLLRILATLIIPTRGQATVGGFDVERESNHARRLFGYHTGDEGFYARLSARENLAFFGAMNDLSRADTRERIEAIAELMGIHNDLNRQVRTFSTGMMHRLGLARALLHRPAILLLDEPTRSLDPLAAAAFRRLLKEDVLRKGGATLLFASHTLSEVEELADRVILLDEGRVIAFDSPKGLCSATNTTSLEAAVSSLVGHPVPLQDRV